MVLGHVLTLFDPILRNNHWKKIKKLEFNIDLEQKLLNSMRKPQNHFELNLNHNRAGHSPILSYSVETTLFNLNNKISLEQNINLIETN